MHIFVNLRIATVGYYKHHVLYILKTRGTSSIPDYVQIRDNNFILVHHFRIDQLEKGLQNTMPEKGIDSLRKLIESVPFGKLVKIGG